MSAREELRADFDELLKLERGWWYDGGGEPVPMSVAAWFERWLSESSDDDLEGWRVFSREDGGLSLDRVSNCRRIHDTVDVLAATIRFMREVRVRWVRVPTFYYETWEAEATFDLFTHELLGASADPI